MWRDKLILSAMSLDLLAVFFGGAVALLPIFATDILQVGPSGLGWLRAAPAIGAGLMSVWLAHHGVTRDGGLVLLASVAMFGVATIGFGLATAAWLSFAMLFLTGVFDAVSVVLRISLVQMRTPDALRGRVAAVNSLFISCSNQWGAVESASRPSGSARCRRSSSAARPPCSSSVVIGLLSKQLREWQHG